MKGHIAYDVSKRGGDSNAALSLVYELIADAAFRKIRAAIGDRRPRVVAVHAEEAKGRNKIPMAYAEVLAAVLKLDTDPGIIQSTYANHSSAESIYHRFVTQPLFDGYVEKGADYLIVDDTCTAGGTLANLRGYIEKSGGNVIAISTLAISSPSLSYDISLANSTLKRLEYKHPALNELWIEEIGYGTECLTEGEAGHLLSAPSTDTIRNRLAEARRDLNIC